MLLILTKFHIWFLCVFLMFKLRLRVSFDYIKFIICLPLWFVVIIHFNEAEVMRATHLTLLPHPSAYSPTNFGRFALSDYFVFVPTTPILGRPINCPVAARNSILNLVYQRSYCYSRPACSTIEGASVIVEKPPIPFYLCSTSTTKNAIVIL